MPREFGTRTQIALLIYSTLNIAVFTAGIYVVMLSPALHADAGLWIAGIVAASLIVTAPLAWCAAACWPAAWRRKVVAERSPLANAPTRPV